MNGLRSKPAKRDVTSAMRTSPRSAAATVSSPISSSGLNFVESKRNAKRSRLPPASLNSTRYFLGSRSRSPRSPERSSLTSWIATKSNQLTISAIRRWSFSRRSCAPKLAMFQVATSTRPVALLGIARSSLPGSEL
jgi:hypothetical protein